MSFVSRRYSANEGPEAWSPRLRRAINDGCTAGQWVVVGTQIAVWRVCGGWRICSASVTEELLLRRHNLEDQRFGTRREALAALQLAWWTDAQL